MGGWTCLLSVLINILPFIHHSSFPTTSSYLLSSSGVEVTYIIVVLAVIFILAVGGLAISLYIRYSLETQTNSYFPPSNSSRLFFSSD